MVADKEEAWIWHIVPLPPSVTSGLVDDAGAAIPSWSAAWAAMRVPEGHFASVANRFVLRTVEEGRPDDFRGSFTSTLFSSAARLSGRSLQGEDVAGMDSSSSSSTTTSSAARSVDWTAVFGPQDLTLEVAAYSSDRMWRVLDLLGQSADGTNEWPWPPASPLADEYPITAPLTVLDAPPPLSALSDAGGLLEGSADGRGAGGGGPGAIAGEQSESNSTRLRRALLAVLRDYYRQDRHPELDVSRSPAGGAFGDPSRWDALTPVEDAAVKAGFPRTISMFRTSFAYAVEVGQRRLATDGMEEEDPLASLVNTRV